jgi:hypothetical protein
MHPPNTNTAVRRLEAIYWGVQLIFSNRTSAEFDCL